MSHEGRHYVPVHQSLHKSVYNTLTEAGATFQIGWTIVYTGRGWAKEESAPMGTSSIGCTVHCEMQVQDGL